MDDLDGVIAIREEIIKLTPEDHADYAIYLNYAIKQYEKWYL